MACDLDAADVALAAGIAKLFDDAALDPCGVFDRTRSAHDLGTGLAAGTAAGFGETSRGSAARLSASCTASSLSGTLIAGSGLSTLVVAGGCFEGVTAGTAGLTTGCDEAAEASFRDDAARVEPASERGIEVVPISDGGAFVDVGEVICSLVPNSLMCWPGPWWLGLAGS
jgi:hypothetical protein